MSLWVQTEGETRIEIELREEGLYFEVGPVSWPARGHEGTGGTISFKQFRESPKWLDEFPGLWEKIKEDLQAIDKFE